MRKQLSKKTYQLLLALAFLTALAVRVVAFGRIPGGFNQDGLMAAVDAKALAAYGTDRFGMWLPVHFTAWGFGQMSVLMSYLMVPFIWLGGLSVVTARLPLLISSLAGIAALWGLSRRSFNRRTALVILLLAAICPWHIMQSRWALDCNLFPHFFLFGVYFLAREKGGIYPAMVFFALSMYCYGISVYTVPLFLILACICLLRRKEITGLQAGICALLYLAIAWPFLLCMAINAFGWETVRLPMCTIPYFPGTIRSGDILFFADAPLKQLWMNLCATLRILFQVSGDPLSNEIPGFGTLYLISWPFFLVGLVKLARSRKRSRGTSLIFLWFLTALAACLVTGNVNINRANILFYPMIVITGMGITWAIARIPQMDKVVPALYLVAFVLFVRAYFTTYADNIRYDFMADFGQAVSSLKDTDAETIYITADSQYKGAAHVSEILSLYYLDIDAAEYQAPGFHIRHRYRIPPEIDDGEDAVYVITAEDLPKFGDAYQITQYDRFYTAIKK